MFPRQLDYHTYKFVGGKPISLRLCFDAKERFSAPKMRLAKERALMTAGFACFGQLGSVAVYMYVLQHD
jgi:hypothetical protein